MAKKQDEASFWAALLATNLYKRNQGRLTRQLSAVALLLVLFFGAWTLSQGLLADFKWNRIVKVTEDDGTVTETQVPVPVLTHLVRIGLPLAICAIGTWVVFRIVNFPRFADFLISVEAEMDKVSWPSWPELWVSTVVVIVTMFMLGILLLGFDTFWYWFFSLPYIRFLRF